MMGRYVAGREVWHMLSQEKSVIVFGGKYAVSFIVLSKQNHTTESKVFSKLKQLTPTTFAINPTICN